MITTPRGRVAIRSTSAEMQQLLADALPHERGAVESLPQGLGLRPAEDDASFHWLYWGRCPVVRTRDAGRLLAALEQHLSAPAVAVDDQLFLRLNAGVTAAGEGFLLPSLGANAALVDRQLREAGAALVDAPFAVVDPHKRELVVTAPTIVLRHGPRHRLEGALRTGRTERRVSPGRYPLAEWAVESAGRSYERSTDPVELLTLLAAPTTQRGMEGLIEFADRLRGVVVAVRDVKTVLELKRSSR